MSVYARSKPYPSKTSGTYQCERCGITRPQRHGSTHCKDCKPYILKDKS